MKKLSCIKTIYITDNNGIPDRFDYERTAYPTGVYDTKKGAFKTRQVIEAYMVHGYRYQTREFVGDFESVKELKQFVRDNIHCYQKK